jgi:hypothetical protein
MELPTEIGNQKKAIAEFWKAAREGDKNLDLLHRGVTGFHKFTKDERSLWGMLADKYSEQLAWWGYRPKPKNSPTKPREKTISEMTGKEFLSLLDKAGKAQHKRQSPLFKGVSRSVLSLDPTRKFSTWMAIALMGLGIYWTGNRLVWNWQQLREMTPQEIIQALLNISSIGGGLDIEIPSLEGFSPEQINNAEQIIETGRAMNMSDRDIQIALMTALQESSMQNLEHGDDWWFAANGWGVSDSRGLFQQRDSWGSQECRLDPRCSSQLFYNALSQIGDRVSMDLGDVAQAVQNSAFPDHYDQWEDEAKALLEASK